MSSDFVDLKNIFRKIGSSLHPIDFERIDEFGKINHSFRESDFNNAFEEVCKEESWNFESGRYPKIQTPFLRTLIISQSIFFCKFQRCHT
jgi:hypothetical protein